MSVGSESIRQLQRTLNVPYGDAPAPRRAVASVAMPVQERLPRSAEAEAEGDIFTPSGAAATAGARAAATLREEEARENQPDINRVVEEANSAFASDDRTIRFRMNEGADRVQVQIVDSERDKVIRSIPTDEMLALASRMRSLSGVGAMVDQSR